LNSDCVIGKRSSNSLIDPAPMASHIRSTSNQAPSHILPLVTKSLRWSAS